LARSIDTRTATRKAAPAAWQKEAPMKINVKGDTPMERLTNLTKRVVAVDKAEIEKLETKWQKRKVKRKRL
jgi:hypothetical protein